MAVTFLALCSVVSAQSVHGTNSSLPNYFARVWQTQDGLPDNNVTSVLQTRDAYLWVGTRSGLARFDGARFVVFNDRNTPEMHSRHVTCLFEAEDGTLWIGHDTGEVTCRREGRFQAVPIPPDWREAKIFDIGADPAGDIWLLNQYGDLTRVKDGLVIPAPSDRTAHLFTMARDQRGGFWIQRDNEVSVLEEAQLRHVQFDGGSSNAYVQGISVSRDGALWVMVESQMRQWKGQKWITELGPAPWDWSPVHTLIETSDGYLAGATVDLGLFIVVPGVGSLRFSRTNGFASDWVTSLCEDREGNLWAGTANGGLAMLRAVNVTTLNPDDQWRGRAALSVAAAGDDTLWIGTEGAGLYAYHRGSWTNFDESAGIANPYIWSVMLDPRNQVWAGTWGNGLFLQTENAFENPAGLQDLSVGALLNLRGGGFCAGTSTGLLRYDSGQTTWLARKPHLSSADVRAVIEDENGTLWFGMSGGGLGCIQAGTIQQFTEQDGLSSDFVQCLHLESDGTLWIGTLGGGLNRFKNGRFVAITHKQGLPDDVICHIEEDNRGFFWMSTHSGIIRVSRAELNRCADGEIARPYWKSFGLSDGLPTVRCSGGSQPAGCKSADGRIWFATAKGVVGVDPGNVRTNPLPPPVVLEEMRVDGRLVAVPAGRAAPLRVAPGPHRIEFDYTGLSFTAPDEVRFRHRLEGLEQDWVQAGTRRHAKYDYLPPGDYVFHVTACNNDGIWNATGRAQAFIMLPHFWQTLWFRMLAAGMMVCAGGAVVWLDARRRMRFKLERIEQQRAVERERARIAQDIHDDLGASLTRISLISQSARSQLDHAPEAAAEVDRIFNTARELTRAMDEIVWAVNPQHDTLDSLAIYLGKFAQDYLRAAGVRCRLNVPEQLPHWPVTAEVRHNLFLAFKEALHNVVKHASASAAHVRLTLEANAFVLSVEDNGHGFTPGTVTQATSPDPDRLEHCNGLENMRRRLEEIGGVCRIHSQPDRGTTVSFHVKGGVSPRPPGFRSKPSR